MNALSTALAYAEKDWRVFPLKPGGKTPLTPHGCKDATTSPEIIKQWWLRWPSANVGIATGKDSNLIAFDFDVKNGQKGQETYMDLLAKCGTLETLMSTTPSGGWHLFFKYPDIPVGNRAGLLPGLDIRGDGGYIVAPGSSTPEGAYTWKTRMPPEVLPDLLKNLLVNGKAKTESEPFDRKSILDGIPEGQRDNKLYRYVCSLQAKGTTQAEAEILVREAASRCEPPFDLKLAMEKVRRVYDKFDTPQDHPVQELAKLSPINYDQVREEKAKELGIQVGTLDKEVAKARGDVAEDSAGDVVEELTPWPEPVDGVTLLNSIADSFSRHVVLPDGARTVVTLWSIGSFCMDAWRIWPKLLITSPEKRCGKSTLLEALEGVSYRPLLTSSITASSLFRCIEEWTPTLLIDEADCFARDNDELNGIINAGHTKRTATVIRSEKEGDGFKPKKFSVWCPQVIAGIKNQRDTLHDRSIHIQMRRKLPGESAHKMPFDYFEQKQAIRRQCLRWAADNITRLKTASPTVPNHGNDRAEDNWNPLFAIAELVGGQWPDKVLKAYQVMSAGIDDDDTIGPMILSDIRAVFASRACNVIHSDDLVSSLIDLEERPWCEWKHGKPLTKNSLARLLKPFSIKSRQIKIGSINLNGYQKKNFKDAFDRYLSPETPIQNSTTLQASDSKSFSDIQNPTKDHPVEFQKRLKASHSKGCREVEFQKGDNGSKGRNGGYPAGLFEAATTACSGLNISAGDFISQLDTGDYSEIINNPAVARGTAQSMAARR